MNGPLFSLAGCTAMVTGAGRGIGRAIAVGLAAAGADIVLAGRNGRNAATAEAITALGRCAHVVDLDFSDIEQVRAVGAATAAAHPVDVLVNNAGVIDRRPALEIDRARWASVLDVNLTAPLVLTQQIAPGMLARGGGAVINIASLLSFEGGVRVASYTASKHAVVGLTRALATEWADKGVRVNAIAPGYIDTANTAALREDPVRAAEILARIPAGRWGEPDDLVGAAVFLAAPASRYVTGHVLVVDGGWTAR